MDAIASVITLCADSLRLSQAKTLAGLVAAAMHVQRVSLANIGRALDGTTKHQIKRCWRFCVNPRIETADAMRGIVARLLKKRKKKLLVALDWVDIRGFQTLVASIVLKGRSVPICWATAIVPMRWLRDWLTPPYTTTSVARPSSPAAGSTASRPSRCPCSPQTSAAANTPAPSLRYQLSISPSPRRSRDAPRAT